MYNKLLDCILKYLTAHRDIVIQSCAHYIHIFFCIFHLFSFCNVQYISQEISKNWAFWKWLIFPWNILLLDCKGVVQLFISGTPWKGSSVRNASWPRAYNCKVPWTCPTHARTESGAAAAAGEGVYQTCFCTARNPWFQGINFAVSYKGTAMICVHC